MDADTENNHLGHLGTITMTVFYLTCKLTHVIKNKIKYVLKYSSLKSLYFCIIN